MGWGLVRGKYIERQHTMIYTMVTKSAKKKKESRKPLPSKGTQPIKNSSMDINQNLFRFPLFIKSREVIRMKLSNIFSPAHFQ